MNRDPVVEELRMTRQRILEECGGDLDRLLDRFKAAEGVDSRRLVSAVTLKESLSKSGPRPH
jgi:hypothetical protein